MNLVICAMEEELIETLKVLQPTAIFSFKHIKLYQKGNYLFAISQIGQVNGASTLTTLINTYALKAIYNVGTVGSLKEKFKILDTFIISRAYYTFSDARGFGYAMGQIPREEPFYQSDQKLITLVEELVYPLKRAVLGTSDVFLDKKVDLRTIETNFNGEIDVVDMEGTAFFQIARKYNIPMISIKVVSDYVKASEMSTNQFNHNLLQASIIIRDLILQLIASN